MCKVYLQVYLRRGQKVWALMINFPRASESVPPVHTRRCVTLGREGQSSRSIIHPADWFIGSGMKGQSPRGWYGTKGERESNTFLTRSMEDRDEVVFGNKNHSGIYYLWCFTLMVTGWWHRQCVDFTWRPNGAQLSKFTRILITRVSSSATGLQGQCTVRYCVSMVFEFLHHGLPDLTLLYSIFTPNLFGVFVAAVKSVNCILMRSKQVGRDHLKSFCSLVTAKPTNQTENFMMVNIWF